MNTRTLTFSIPSIKAVNKYLKVQSEQTMTDALLTNDEREALLDAYGQFREEVEEMEIDEAYNEANKNV